MMRASVHPARLKEIALVFLKLGITSFGGPAVHIAMMEAEIVQRRRWISEAQFLDFLAATNLIPGPNSTEMAIHIGYERGGKRGLVLAGICFIVPAMLIVLAIAWGYTTYGRLPEVQGVLYGIKPVVLAVVAQAIWNLTKKTAAQSRSLFFATAAAIFSLLGGSELAVLLASGVIGAIVEFRISGTGSRNVLSVVVGSFYKPGALVGLSTGVIAYSHAKLFFFFLKVGSDLYGSGYVLLAFLQGELVEHLGWLTQSQLLDAIAVGQFTPGPVFTTATFIGYLLAGVSGGLIATLGIFLPSFVFVGFSTRLIPWLRKTALARAFLNGVTAASLGLMAAVTVRLGRDAIVDPTSATLAIVSTLIFLRWKPNSLWLVMGGGGLGYLLAHPTGY